MEQRDTSNRQSDRFFPRLEALRGLAALTVAAFHTWQSSWNDTSGLTRSFLHSTADGVYGGWTTTVLTIFGNGFAAVNLFFVLSGFVLLQSLVRGAGSRFGNSTRFIIARLFRIYPAVVATIAVFVLVFYATGAALVQPSYYAPASLLRNVLLIETTIDGVMWTLKIEVIAIPLFILGFLLFRRFGISGLVVLLMALMGLSTAKQWTTLVDGPLGLTALPFFSVGMLVFGSAKPFWSRMPSRIAAALVAITFAGVLCLPLLGLGFRTRSIIEMICEAFLVGGLAFGALGMIGKFFDHRLIRFYGRISYSFYLLNPLTLLVLWHIPAPLGEVVRLPIPGVLVALALFAISVAATTPLAWLMHKYVERPCIAMGQRLLAKRLNAAFASIDPRSASSIWGRPSPPL